MSDNDENDIIDPDTDRYILDECGEPQRCPSLLKWARAMDDPRRQVAETFLADGTRVSTIFLGLDHNHLWLYLRRRGTHRPILYETMAFPVAHQDEDRGEIIDQERYCTRDEAVRGHCEMVARWTAVLAQTQKLLTAIVDSAQAEQCSEQPAPQHDAADLVGLGPDRGRKQVQDEADDGNDDRGGDHDGHADESSAGAAGSKLPGSP